MIREFTADSLLVRVFATREQMGRAAYEHYRERVNARLAHQASIRAIFAAAHSQDDFTAAMRQDTGIDFSRFEAFHMDEYMGLGADAPQNFGNFLKREIFSFKSFGKVNYLRPDAADIAAECARYERLLRATPLDIVSLGIGENGHIAFNDPPEARFDDPAWVREVTIDDVSRQQQVNDGEFDSIGQVPRQAVTLTIPCLMSCASVVGIVPTDRKAEAVREALYGPLSEACPASILRRHPDAVLFLDAQAAAML